ncbi:MAG TPA: glycosyltransferase, partial [Acidimicrobiales bacterium]|nr:glycosyltransferase [Acidimicrobiales bacterium]
MVLFSVFLVCAGALLASAILLVTTGRVVRRSSRLAALVLCAAVSSLAGYAVTAVWGLPEHLVVAAAVLELVVVAAVALVRPEWNPVGQCFFAALATAAAVYLGFAADVTVAGGLSPIGSLASALLFVLEAFALVIAGTFAFETCDVICRVRHSRSFPSPDPSYRPMVSVQVAAYNEPPDMLIETIKHLAAIEYPDFEVVVVDNNTSDPEVWQPVEAFCRDLDRVKFTHVEPWPGYKSGALNLALMRLTDPRAELVAVVDSDYLVDPGWLEATVGYFADPQVAFLQTPQDYREYEDNPYLTACYDAYRYFFASAMPSRNERNSIIFAGTMGVLRRRVLEELGGWSEWCITEDAETSLRMLRAGYSGLFLSQSFGRGIMPLTFSSLKSQRFRWCFGGMQILRRHWRSLLPGFRPRGDRLTVSQRLDYLVGGVQWMNDLVLLCFTLVLLVVAGLLLSGEHVAIRPLVGPTILLPAVLLLTGLLRAVWALRERTGISTRRAVLAFANWLSLSWTVAIACVQGLVRNEGVFLRTPKREDSSKLLTALWAARTETVLALGLWGCAAALAATTGATPLLVGLTAWQGSVYAASPYMSWLEQRGTLPPELERRRRTEVRRERLAAGATAVAHGMGLAGALAAAVLVAV